MGLRGIDRTGERGLPGTRDSMKYHDSQFFTDYLREVVTAPVYIGSAETDLAEEVNRNMWWISVTRHQAETLTQEDFRTFVDEVTENRHRQVEQAEAGHGLIFYLWFDEQACQLRFNLVSDFHDRLPFGCSLKYVETPDEIIESFLKSPYHDGIPLTRSRRDPLDEVVPEADTVDVILPVYVTRLEKR